MISDCYEHHAQDARVTPIEVAPTIGSSNGACLRDEQCIIHTKSDGIASAKAFTLQIRGGVPVDSKGRRAGKGALVKEEHCPCVTAAQDTYLFVFSEDSVDEN